MAKEYSLSELVQFSGLIVVATPLSEKTVVREIEFTKDDYPKNYDVSKFPDGGEVPPYKQHIFKYRIDRILKTSRGLDEAEINVVRADDGMRQREHFRCYAMGMTMSMHSEYYRPSCDIAAADPRILFLSLYQDSYGNDDEVEIHAHTPWNRSRIYKFRVNNAEEGLGCIDNVLDILGTE